MIRSLVVLFCVVLGLPSFAGANDEPAVDLRGPDPKPGLKLREVVRLEMKAADMTLKAEGKLLGTFKLDMTGIDESISTVKTTEGRAVTMFTTRIVKDEMTISVHGPGGTETKEDLGALAGQVVTSEKTKSGWKHTLADGEPSKAQKEALANIPMWEEDEDIPSGKQKIGATWEMDAVHFKKVLGGSITAASGKVRKTFTGLTKHNGELCAVIEWTGSIKGKLTADGNEKLFTLGQLKNTEYRSLKHGVSLKWEMEMSWKLSGKEKVEGNEVDVVIQGKAIVKSETEVRD